MYKGKFCKTKRRSRKPIILLVSLMVLLNVSIFGTLAYLIDVSESIANTFTPSRVPNIVVEELDGNVKNNVRIQNDGNTDAFIRAAVVVTWVKRDGDGNLLTYGKKPVDVGDDKDYVITFPTDSGWVKGSDGYYYYTAAVPVDNSATTDVLENQTGVLFTDCHPVEGKTPEGYQLSVEIMGQSIQAKGTDEDGNKPVVLAWGTGNGGSVESATETTLTVKTKEE